VTTQSATNIGLSAIDQISLSCTDLDQAQHFYCDILGLRYGGEVPGVFKFFDCNGVNIIMHKNEKVAPASILYFRAPGTPGGIEQKVEQLKLMGVTIEQPAHRIARNWHGYDVFLAFFRDPFGNMLALKSDVPVK
jgi:catechol 2,3-dioxygenase-like lactoylglutathione lyase family enzyme